MIYFLKANNKVKIGYANDPIKRITAIQTSNPFKLEVLLIIEGSYTKERELHQFFHDFRENGEWFEFSEQIAAYIDNNLIFDRRYEYGFIEEDFLGNEQILRMRKERSLTLQKLGDKLNVTPQSIKDMEEREKNGAVSIKVMEAVASAFDCKFEYRFVPIYSFTFYKFRS